MHPFYDESKIFIASFPKSGSSWFKAIVYHLLNEGKPDFRHIHDEMGGPITDLERPQPRALGMNQKLFGYYGKCSDLPKPNKKLYIMRNPVDVFKSGYDFFPKNRGRKSEDYLKDFMSSEGWKANVDDALSCENILVVKYENLKDDFEKSLREMSDYLELPSSEDKIQRVKELTSFEKMKSEKHKYEIPYLSESEHFNKGKANEYSDQDFQGELAPLKEWYDYYKSLE